MLTLKHIVELDALELQQLYEKLQKSVTLASLVLAAWQIGLWFAHALVKHNRAHLAVGGEEMEG